MEFFFLIYFSAISGKMIELMLNCDQSKMFSNCATSHGEVTFHKEIILPAGAIWP